MSWARTSFLFFRRPPAAVQSDGHLEECKSADHKHNKSEIPPELKFENVICNKCAPPCSLQDFLDYLTYVSHDAENLQFYLWMVDYFQRFRRISKWERAISPRWTGRAPPIKEQDGLRLIATHDIDVMSEDISDCDTWGGYEIMSESTEPYTQTLDDIKFTISPVKPSPRPDQYVWHPAEDQPLRGEITRIINHYLLPNSPRQLNLSHNDRATVLRALEYTTHPSALSPIKKMLDSTLRNRSHPNFIRWTLCNSNSTWIRFLRTMSAISTFMGFLIAILLVCSHVNRFSRLLAVPFWWFGFTNLITSSRGLCAILHRLHYRQAHPWETKTPALADDEEMLKSDFATVMGQGGAITYETSRPSFPMKMEVFGPSNNYAGERWVRTYDGKRWWRRLWEHRIRVQDNGLSRIQNKMIWQAEVWSGILTLILLIIFIALPNANAI